jgi:putative nucleotidyltransferase with HDIG domain
MDHEKATDLVRRLANAVRGLDLYAPAHPVVQRGIEALGSGLLDALRQQPQVVVGFIGDEVVVDSLRLSRRSTTLVSFARDLRDCGIEKVTIARGTTRDEIRALVVTLGERQSTASIGDRLRERGVRHITLARVAVTEPDDELLGMAAAQRVYAGAIDVAETLWEEARAGEKPDPGAARKMVDSLAKLVTQDHTSLVALTTLKRHDNYTFTHMVNVSSLAMAQARTLGIEGPLLRDFGFAALMHDIGKSRTPLEVLNKPDKLTKEEFDIMKRHVVDGAHILRRMPDTPPIVPIVAFEHHLKQDMSGYPERVADRTLNLCTMVVSLADVFDALRTNRPYRQGLATDRVRAIMEERDSPAFNQRLLKRFVNLVGLFPVGSMVRLNTDELGIVVAEHPTDPFRPQVKVVRDAQGVDLEEPWLANTWERDSRGAHERAVVEAVDPEALGIDPLKLL